MKLFAIILAAIAGVFLIGLCTCQGCRNTAINLEETVQSAKSDIDVQLQRRVNLLTELVEAVEHYDQHEAQTLKDVIASRGRDMTGQEVKQLMFQIQAVYEAYPDLKSQKNYEKLMNECSLTENMVAQHKKAFNTGVKEYKAYCRSFPANLGLVFSGYDVQRFKYYETNADDSQPLQLFNRRSTSNR